jgi:TPR repeat protein
MARFHIEHYVFHTLYPHSYSGGVGIDRNDAEAVRWLRLAANQNVRAAQVRSIALAPK